MSIKIFNPESYAGGGTFFADGKYQHTECRFVMFDFGGSVPDGIACLRIQLQPLDKDNKPVGEPVTQHWSAGGDCEIKNKGRELELKGDYSTLWNKGDLCLYMDHLGKAGFDRDEYGESEDISVLDGLIVEYGKVPPLREQKEKINPKTGKPYPPTMVPVPVKVLKMGAGGGAKGGSAKAEPAASSSSGGAKELLLDYLENSVCTSENAKKGVEKLDARMGIKPYAKKKGADAETAQAATKLFNSEEDLKKLLESLSWVLDGSKLKPE